MEKTMTKKEVEELILGINDNQTKSWRMLQSKWEGGVLVMPQDELVRRAEYRARLKEIFGEYGINENSFPGDSWLSGKIRRILER